MNLRLRILVAALPSAIGAVAAQWHTSCVFDRLDDPHALCILSYFWYPPAMDVAFALLVLAPFLGAVRLRVLRVVGLVGASVLVHALAVDFTIGLRGTIDVPGIDSIFLNVIPVAIAASLVIAVGTVWLAGRTPRPRLWGLATIVGLVAALVFLLPDLLGSALGADRVDLVRYGPSATWLAWHLGMAAALHLGLDRYLGPVTAPPMPGEEKSRK